MAPWSVNADTPTRADEETNSEDAERFERLRYRKYIHIDNIYRGRWQESVAYIGGVGRRA